MNEEIDEFYMLKKNYMNKKNNRCINCNRSVGTDFKVEFYSDKRILKIECGDKDNPCDLKKEVSVSKKFNRDDYIRELNMKKKELEDEILKLKNKLLYELITENQYNNLYEKINNDYKMIVKELEKSNANIDKEDMKREVIKNKLSEEIENNLEIENEDDRMFNVINKIRPISKLYQDNLTLVKEENETYRLQYFKTKTIT